ncbi:MAG: ABC transporter permease, partial [Desulfobacterales bacterium]|nr:ABC transporter permease [Desulfobacterales bacterium]
MNFKRLWAMFMARNREYFRDRAALGWNFVFPFLLIGGFAVIFGDKSFTEYKIGVFPHDAEIVSADRLDLPDRFKKDDGLKFIGLADREMGLERLGHHKIDLLIQLGGPPYRYWISDSSPKGDVSEKILHAALLDSENAKILEKKEISGGGIRYVDWLFPGILAMNMMFSSLYGVGYVIVRYRKNGVLKRLKATPLTAVEYLTAQMLSRMFLLMFSVIVVWVGCTMIFSFQVKGSYLLMLLI